MYCVLTKKKKIWSMTVMNDWALKNSYLSNYIAAEGEKTSIYRLITVDILEALIL